MPRKRRPGQTRKVRVGDLATLIFAIKDATDRKDIGWNDADNTMLAIMGKLNVDIRVHKDEIESALYCAKMLDEKKKFRDYKGRTFKEFVGGLKQKGENYHGVYNYFFGGEGDEL